MAREGGSDDDNFVGYDNCYLAKDMQVLDNVWQHNSLIGA
jgi:hypothetical protein